MALSRITDDVLFVIIDALKIEDIILLGAASRRLRGLLRRAALRALPAALFITFLVVPSVSLLAFQAFRCECFENG